MTIPLDDSQDPMPPVTVAVSDPIVTGVHPVPDESDKDQSLEGYSEGGLSGEATIDTNLSCCISTQMKKSPTITRASSVGRAVGRMTTLRVRRGSVAGPRLRNSRTQIYGCKFCIPALCPMSLRRWLRHRFVPQARAVSGSLERECHPLGQILARLMPNLLPILAVATSA